MPDTGSSARRVRLFRNNRNQAIRIPAEFELPGSEAIIRREGTKLVIEPLPPAKLLDLLADWEPLDEPFPAVDATLLPPRPVEL